MVLNHRVLYAPLKELVTSQYSRCCEEKGFVGSVEFKLPLCILGTGGVVATASWEKTGDILIGVEWGEVKFFTVHHKGYSTRFYTNLEEF